MSCRKDLGKQGSYRQVFVKFKDFSRTVSTGVYFINSGKTYKIAQLLSVIKYNICVCDAVKTRESRIHTGKFL